MVTTTNHDEALEKQSELKLTLQEMQQNNILLILLVLFFIGILAVAGSAELEDTLNGSLVGVVLYILIACVWSARRSDYLSAWFLVIGLTTLIIFLVWSIKISPLICILAFPAGVAMLMISSWCGILTAVVYTLMIFFPLAFRVPDTALKITALLVIWSTVFLVWMTKRPLLTALEWTWSIYEQSHDLLERARDYQVELKQALEDLATVNSQMNRLNRLAQGLRQMAEEARHEKEQFVARVSHELRTPLNMIIGFSEMILKSPGAYGRKLPPALLADLAVISRNSQHLSDLIDDVLDLSQIQSGQMAMNKELASLKDIIESAAIAVRPLFNSKGLSLEIDIPEDSKLFCDRIRIREVVINLLSNAGRFTDQGGVKVAARQEGPDYKVSVADTGPGISEENLQKIFLPFQQADASIHSRYGGTGLGLSISQSFVDLHGGKMWGKSQLGNGATFYFTLPVNPPVEVKGDFSRWFSPHFHYEEKIHHPSVPKRPISPRFLVVDQGGALTHLLTRYMDEVEIVPVKSLEDARQLIPQTPVQALIINSHVNNNLLMQLRNTDIPYGTPVLVYAMPGLRDVASSLGVSGYLVKPISRETLLRTFENLPLPNKTVLIVDDELEALQLFRRMLISEDQEYRVITASNGKQAMQILEKETPDVILLDLVMPEMNGYLVIEALSQNPQLSSIPVVVISANDQMNQALITETMAMWRSGGFSTEQLLASIRDFSQILGTPGLSAD